MFRAILTLSLIVNLLACPLNCCSGNAVAVSVDEWAPVVCSCCSHGSESSESSDDSPADDCDCPNCLCEGATLQDGVQLPMAYSEPAFVGYGLVVVPSTSGASIRRIAARESDDGRLDFCGRGALVAFQSWLI